MRSRIVLTVVLALLALTPLAARAQRGAAPPPAPAMTPEALAESALVGLPELPAGAPGGARDYLAEARAGFSADNRTYQSIRVTLSFVRPLFAIGVALFLLFSGLAARMRDMAVRASKYFYLQVLVMFTVWFLTTWLIGLPVRWYSGWALEHQFELGTQSFGEWLMDDLKGAAFSLVVLGVVPVLALAWMKMRQSPRRWWLWMAAGTVPVAAAAILLQPLVFEPLFNKFTPLENEVLREKILALGARAGIPAKDVLQADMSRQTNRINAYVSGFGATQRIVLWDTTLERMREDEILFVMAHEMGHYVLGHTWKALGLVAVGAFVVFFAASRVVRWAIARWGGAWGFAEVGDLAAMPLLAATLTLVATLVNPFDNAVSRYVEHESDVYALEITRDNDAGARAFLKLAANNRSDPEPAGWVKLWMYTHPPLGERIRFAMEYKPWERGEGNRVYRGKVEGE